MAAFHSAGAGRLGADAGEPGQPVCCWRKLNWKGFDRSYPRRKIALPTYPFQRQRYWVDLETAKPAVKKHEQDAHPFLERQLRSPNWQKASSNPAFQPAGLLS